MDVGSEDEEDGVVGEVSVVEDFEEITIVKNELLEEEESLAGTVDLKGYGEEVVAGVGGEMVGQENVGEVGVDGLGGVEDEGRMGEVGTDYGKIILEIVETNSVSDIVIAEVSGSDSWRCAEHTGRLRPRDEKKNVSGIGKKKTE